jgi:hypothetical protein
MVENSVDSTVPADGQQVVADSGASGGWVPPPWEPPLAGTELDHLLGALNRQRATFRWKADGLDAGGLRTRIGASNLTLAGLLKHLAVVEDQKFTVWLSGAPLGEPWASLGGPPEGDDDDVWVFTSALDDSPDALYALYDGAVQRSHERLGAALANGGLDQLVHIQWGDLGRLSLRRILFDLLEEYGRHTGHADLLREVVDGRVGEDPPSDWRPSGSTSV